MVPEGLAGSSEIERQVAIILRKTYVRLPFQLPVDVELDEVGSTNRGHMIPHARAQGGHGLDFHGHPGRRGDNKSKHVLPGNARFLHVKTFEIAAPAVLLENNILVASRRSSRGGRVQGIKSNPGLDRQIGWVQDRR